MAVKIIATMKPFKEIFPNVDIREFEALRSLNDDTYNIEISINEAKYSLDMENIEREILFITDVSEINDNSIYQCCVPGSNSRKAEVWTIYGSWIKSVRVEDEVPYKKEFFEIIKLMEQYDNEEKYNYDSVKIMEERTKKYYGDNYK